MEVVVEDADHVRLVRVPRAGVAARGDGHGHWWGMVWVAAAKVDRAKGTADLSGPKGSGEERPDQEIWIRSGRAACWGKDGHLKLSLGAEASADSG